MSCKYIEAGEPCGAIAEWLIEGNTSGELDHPSTHQRTVCGDSEHVLQTIVEFINQGIGLVLVSEYVEPR